MKVFAGDLNPKANASTGFDSQSSFAPGINQMGFAPNNSIKSVKKRRGSPAAVLADKISAERLHLSRKIAMGQERSKNKNTKSRKLTDGELGMMTVDDDEFENEEKPKIYPDV